MKKNLVFLSSLFFILFIFSILFFPLKSLAQDRELEIEYPEIGGVQPKTVGIGVVEYVRYIFNLIIVLCGVIAFGVLVLAGVRYLTSTDQPATLQSAKKEILAAFLGLFILLVSWLILFTINPQLVSIQLPSRVEPPPYSPLPPG